MKMQHPLKNWKTLFPNNKTAQSNTQTHATKKEVVVHFHVPQKSLAQNLGINPNCFLIDNYEGEKIALLASENIATAPAVTSIEANTAHLFTLRFSALPAACTGFDILEDVPSESGLFIPHVKRNALDIYHIHLQ